MAKRERFNMAFQYLRKNGIAHTQKDICVRNSPHAEGHLRQDWKERVQCLQGVQGRRQGAYIRLPTGFQQCFRVYIQHLVAY